MLGATHDLSAPMRIRPLGGTLVARLYEDGEAKTFALGREGAVPMPRSWPRLLHEGTWGGSVLAVLNFVAAVALLGLLGTGLVIWTRRKFGRSRRGTGRVGAG